MDAGGARPGAGAPPVNRWLTLAVLCVPLLIVSLDNTVLNVALPTLVRKLRASDSELQWIVDAYVLAFGGLMLVSGSVADRVGRKRTFLIGLMIFAACSTWAALSNSSRMLIAARASMGLGATLIMPATLAIITNTFTDRGERQRALGIWAGTTGAGVALGPIIGGLLLAHFAWGSVFLINVPIALLGLAAGIRFVPNSRNEHAQRPDLVGAPLSILGLGLVLWAVIEAPVHGWTSTEVLATGVGGLVVLAGFVAWESRSSHPMVRLAFFRQAGFSASIVSTATMMFALMGMLFVLTQFLQFQLGYSALQAGIHMLPAAGGIAVVAPFSAVAVRRMGTKLTVALGLALVAGGLWQISGATVSTSYSGVVAGAILIGIGAGLTMPACTGSLMGTLPLEHAGVGAATNGSCLNLGGAFGVAILGSLMSTRYQHGLLAGRAVHELNAAVHQTVLGSLGAALGVAGHVGGLLGSELSVAARAAFMSGLGLALTAGAGVVAVGVVLALLALPSRPPSPPTTDATGGDDLPDVRVRARDAVSADASTHAAPPRANAAVGPTRATSIPAAADPAALPTAIAV
jgi:EmrB/QacA subfamily drug resistance transporter